MNDMVLRLWNMRGAKETIGVLCIIALALGSWGTIRYARHIRVNALTRQGNEALVQSDFAKAFRSYKAALSLDKTNMHVLAALLNTGAMMQNRMGEAPVSDAETDGYIEDALVQSEGNRELLEAVGYALEAKKEYTQALSFYEKALALDPADAKLWFHIGHAHEFLGHVAQSQEAYEKAYALDPAENSLILLAQAREAQKKNDADAAYNFFLKASAVSPVAYLKAEALAAASAIKRDQGYLEEARVLAENAVQADPGYAPAKISIGMAVAMGGDTVKAVDEIYEAIQMNPSAVQGYWAMGIVLRNSGYFKEGLEYFNAGLARIKDDVSLVGPHEKDKAAALFLYDIAKTQDIIGGRAQTQTLQLLENAVQLNRDLGQYLREDAEKFNFFRTLKASDRFILLLPAGSP
ncbi:MAG: tetratricopeptide repeat protein [Candidatus Wildermuthbacteria bacterium]|nr:tetratricopeptide repeat protein [Candidatus Wildermuthbacteria bacterium]